MWLTAPPDRNLGFMYNDDKKHPTKNEGLPDKVGTLKLTKNQTVDPTAIDPRPWCWTIAPGPGYGGKLFLLRRG